jgi:nicotinamide mononucleotide adenylyltransferase
MNKDTLEKMAVTAFANLQSKRLDLFTAAEHSITVRQSLEDAKTQASIGGVFDGKNAEIREAQARDHLQTEYAEVTAAEKTERRCRHEFDRASIDVDTVKTLLRIAELVE